MSLASTKDRHSHPGKAHSGGAHDQFIASLRAVEDIIVLRESFNSADSGEFVVDAFSWLVSGVTGRRLNDCFKVHR